VAVRRQLAVAEDGAVVMAIDLRRYERWLLEATHAAVDQGLTVVALTDEPLSPLARAAWRSFVVTARSPGPFDSHVGTLALLGLLVTRVAEAVRPTAADRLARAESALGGSEALTDG